MDWGRKVMFSFCRVLCPSDIGYRRSDVAHNYLYNQQDNENLHLAAHTYVKRVIFEYVSSKSHLLMLILYYPEENVLLELNTFGINVSFLTLIQKLTPLVLGRRS